MTWKLTSSYPTKKFKAIQYIRRIMATVFWDCKRVLLVDFLDHGDTVTAGFTVVPLRGYSRLFVSNSLGCCVKVASFCTKTPGPILPTTLVTGYNTTDGRLWTTLRTVPNLCPVIFVPVDTLRSTWLASTLQHIST